MAETNVLLAALLDEARISRAGLAARINQLSAAKGSIGTNYDHTSIGRWIKLGQVPRGDASELVCRVFSDRLHRAITLADIGMDQQQANVPVDTQPLSLDPLISKSSALWRSDAHRQIDPASSVKSGMEALAPLVVWENPPEWQHLEHAGAHSVDFGDIELLRSARQRYEQMYRLVGGLAVRPRITEFLHVRCTPLLKGTYTDELGRQLFRAVGGLVALTGICAYDSDEHGAANAITTRRGAILKPRETSNLAHTLSHC